MEYPIPHGRSVATRLVIAVLLGLQSFADSRQLGVDLNGDELLIEYEKVSTSAANPGIHAVDRDGNCVLVVSYGRDPKWAPDRTKFAFRASDEVYIADIKAKSIRSAFPAGGLGLRPSLYADFTSVRSGVGWTPDSREVVTWVRWQDFHDEKGETCFKVPVSVPFSEKLPHILPIAWHGPVDIGRFSYSPDGTKVAVETMKPVPGFGCSDRQVWVTSIAEKRSWAVVPKVEDLKGVLNPCWSPSGRFLAVDYATTTGGRHVAVIEVETGETHKATAGWLATWWGSFVGWSPSEDLALISVRRLSEGGNRLRAFQFKGGEFSGPSRRHVLDGIC